MRTKGIASLEKLMKDFSAHHRTAPVVPAGFVPKGGDLVSAKFSDGAWYRAKIKRASPVKKEAEVVFIDYGNQDTIPFSSIRPLDPKFRSLPGQAHDARLRYDFVQLFCLSAYEPVASLNWSDLKASTTLRPLIASVLYARDAS